MAEVVTNLKVKFGADTSQFKKGMTGAEKELAGFKSQMVSQFKGIGIAAATAFSIKAIIDFGKRAAEAADVQLQAEQKLLVALKGRQDVTDKLITQAQDLQKITLWGDEETINAMANLGAFVKNEEAIKSLMPVIQDMATAMKMDLAAAATLVGKTIGSSTNALKRYGIDIEGVAGSNQRAASAVEALSDKFGGQAQAAAKIGLGPWKQLKNMIGDLVEDFGKLFMPGIQKVSNAMIKAFPTGMINDFRDKVIDLVNWFRELYNESLPVRVAVAYIGIAFKNAWAVIEFVFKNIFAQFSTFGKVAKAILTGNFSDIPNIIKGHFDKVTASAVDFGKDVYGNIKKGFEGTATNRVELIDKNKVKEQGKAAGGAFIDGFDDGTDTGKLKGTYENLSAKIDELVKKQKELASTGKDISVISSQITILEKQKQAIDDLVKSQDSYSAVISKIAALTAEQKKLSAAGKDTTWINTVIAELQNEKKAVVENITALSSYIKLSEAYDAQSFISAQQSASDELDRLQITIELISLKISELISKQNELAAAGKDISGISAQIDGLLKQKEALKESLKAQESLVNSINQYDPFIAKIRELRTEQEKLTAAGKDISGITAQIAALTQQQQELANTGASYRQLREEIDKAFDAELKLREQMIKPFTERESVDIVTPKKEQSKTIDTTQLMPMKMLSDEQIDEYKSKLEEMRGVTIDIGAEMQSAFADIAVGLSESIGKMIVGVGGFSDIGKVMLSALGDLAIQVGKIAIVTGLTVKGIKATLETLNPALAIVAGVALVALGSAIKGAMSGISKGSSYSGSTGTYDTRTFSETNRLSTAKSTAITVNVVGETVIRNRDIYIAYQNAENNSRIGT
jgi:uncharacterized coiled-coil DUF342 family protein